jgi:hypothetical protein
VTEIQSFGIEGKMFSLFNQWIIQSTKILKRSRASKNVQRQNVSDRITKNYILSG